VDRVTAPAGAWKPPIGGQFWPERESAHHQKSLAAWLTNYASSWMTHIKSSAWELATDSQPASTPEVGCCPDLAGFPRLELKFVAGITASCFTQPETDNKIFAHLDRSRV